MEKLESEIASARVQISDKLGISGSKCLTEYDAFPDQNLANAKKLSAAGRAALQHGGVDAASQAIEQLNSEIETGHSLITRSLEVLGKFDGDLMRLRQRHDEVGDKVPSHEQLLQEVRQKYAQTALVLQAGDPSYEDPAATVDSHLAGCRDSLGDASRLMEEAAGKFAEGKLIESDEMLEMAAAHIEEADKRLDEIDQHCTRLASVSRENEGKLTSMHREATGFDNKIDDRRTMQPTIREYRALLDEIRAAQQEIERTLPRDPFHDGAAIDQFSENVANIKARIEADHDAHEEASRAVAGARKERESAEQLISTARHDGIPDSPGTTAGIQEIRSFDGRLSEVERQLNTPHFDWQEVDHSAARVHGELGVAAGRLRGELERAQRLVSVFRTASDTVFQATRWTGGFGTRIFGSPGSSELERARKALNRGDYSAMAELARAAQIAAQHAIQRAQREVYRRQREAARRAEAARRRRRQSSNIGGGGFGSGGGIRIGGGSRSSGGSSRRSSSRSSSGSGFSRSGW